MMHPHDLSYIADPYTTLQKLRKEQPVYLASDIGLWIVSRYEDVTRVLKDTQSFSNLLSTAPIAPLNPPTQKKLSQVPLCPVASSSDPPDHTRFRRAINRFFPHNDKHAKQYEPMIQQIVDELIQKNLNEKEIDLIKAFAWELPVLVIFALLGVPEKDFAKIKGWSDGLVDITWGYPSEEDQMRLASSMEAFTQYAHQLVEQKLDQPGDDFVSGLIKYRNGDDSVLTINEIAVTALSILTAGHETTANLIANSIYHSLQHHLWKQMTDDPAIIPQVVEETLRFDSPLIGWLKYTLQEATIGEVTIPAHQRVLVMLGSANRDEQQFADAEVFNIQRDAKHLSFGLGPHYCIGASLARLETKIALQTLTKHFPNLQLQSNFTPDYLPNMVVRAMKQLPVIL